MSIAAVSAPASVIHLNPRQTEEPARTAMPDGRSAAGTGSAKGEDRASSDPVAAIIKQMQERLRQVMMQIQRLQASKIPAEQKMQRLRALNDEATQLQQQITQALRAARGGISA